MYRYLTIIVLSVIVSTSSLYAQATIPREVVTVDPRGAATGASVAISALVYNSHSETVTMTVVFVADGVRIGAQKASIDARSAKTLVQPWTVPAPGATVTASVTSALTKSKKDIIALHGILGSVDVGTLSVEQPLSKKSTATLFSFVDPFKVRIETFRMAQGLHFKILRDEMKKKLGIDTVADIQKELAPPDAPVPFAEEPSTAPVALDSPMDYLTLIYATALASIFGSAVMFYGIAVVLVLLLLRTIFRMFV